MAYTFIAAAAFGLEGVVARELKRMGLQATAETGGARFTGEAADALAANLRLRTADRVLMVLYEGEATTFEELYQAVSSVAWETLMTPDASIPVSGKCVRSRLMSVRDCQAVAKKAIVNRLLSHLRVQTLPETGAPHPVEVSLRQDRLRITLDMSGEALNRRGYRTWNGEAPLRETLGAALVELSPWRPGRPLYDPCCGTGTLLIEAALLATRRAPGQNRAFACERYAFLPRDTAKAVRAQALADATPDVPLMIAGSDIDPEALSLCRRHIDQAGLAGRIPVTAIDLRTLSVPGENGVFLCNPPYGERLGDQKAARELAKELGLLLGRHPSWKMGVISADTGFERAFGRRADRKRRLYNGRLECEFFLYS